MNGFTRFFETPEQTVWLRKYFAHPQVDLINYIHQFLDWKGSTAILKRARISKKKINQAAEEMTDDIYELCEKIEKKMTDQERNEFLDLLARDGYGDTPSHALMSLNKHRRLGLLPPTTWLIHFSDDAEAIHQQGLKFGQSDPGRLALTTHQGDQEKSYGGYNFAFTADGRHARAAAFENKYGRHAVMFQAAGVSVYHYSDEEDQVILWGEGVPANRMVLLVRDDNEWSVVGRDHREYFKDIFDKVVAWVKQNYFQYRRVL